MVPKDMKSFNMNITGNRIGSMILSLTITSITLADVRLPTLFSEGMVLQRNIEVPVWGWSRRGEPVTVRYRNQTKTTTADGQGNWMIKLDPMAAVGDPFTLTVEGHNTITIENVLVGEVWLASGQGLS